jgi:hypothetical protein
MKTFKTMLLAAFIGIAVIQVIVIPLVLLIFWAFDSIFTGGSLWELYIDSWGATTALGFLFEMLVYCAPLTILYALINVTFKDESESDAKRNEERMKEMRLAMRPVRYSDFNITEDESDSDAKRKEERVP